MQESDLRFFDSDDELDIVHKNLPHWTQPGTICFMTWRTADSLPEKAQRVITEERRSTLKSHGVDPDGDLRKQLWDFRAEARWRIRKLMLEVWDRRLDAGHGRCVLRDKTLADGVAKSLLRFDEDRYVVTDYVVMPNHVHLLVGFATAELLLSQPTSWKRFTGREINPAI